MTYTNTNITVNAQCFNAVMKSAAYTEGSLNQQLDAFNLATAIMEELLKSDIKPNSSSFGTYIKACGKLNIARKLVDPQIEKMFADCLKLGLVNSFVLTQLKNATSPNQFQHLLGKLSEGKTLGKWVDMDDIPS